MGGWDQNYLREIVRRSVERIQLAHDRGRLRSCEYGDEPTSSYATELVIGEIGRIVRILGA
jgi:hypothetical protein